MSFVREGDKNMDEVDRWIFEQQYRRAVGRTIRDTSSPLNTLDEEQFRMRYRLTRRSFFFVCSVIEDGLSFPDGRCRTFLTAIALAVTLQTLATKNFQLTEADLFGISQPTVSRILTGVFNAIIRNNGMFIKWPTARQEESIKMKFYELTGIPNVIGCIDGTFVRLHPPHANAHAYVTRKEAKALNVGLACDCNRRFFGYLLNSWAELMTPEHPIIPARNRAGEYFRNNSAKRALRKQSDKKR
ncbi:hypothetical protein ANCDUO_02723 [Ancylostoma duodenale]|uniref:Nuclease HARBI1 n=1 Tax=Ancylostoma duodenale TaxID=51022 RepID=A0A0C2DB37_9BILA|nr:hypothetical protein ANCDUO_02723 [Ancylostoma duodenale]